MSYIYNSTQNLILCLNKYKKENKKRSHFCSELLIDICNFLYKLMYCVFQSLRGSFCTLINNTLFAAFIIYITKYF